jgi:hypothetical protein
MRCFGFGVAALALLGLGAPKAAACGWLWPCTDRPYASRDAPPTYGYASPRRRGHGYYGKPRWSYGFTSPARAYGNAYAAWPSTAIPPSRWYLRTALPGANTNTIGLTPPVYGLQGLQWGGMPARGPTLFGPQPTPPGAWGYYYGGYYGARAYGYYAVPSPSTPPSETPSWWVEPRRRR